MRQGRQNAFTLLEMSIVLVIMAALLGGGITTLLAYTAKKGYQNTEHRLKEIEAALVQYRKVFNRLPCPADITKVIETAEFGKEASNKGACTGGAIAANLSSGNMVSGMVPTRALGLDDEMAFDSWGRRIRYAVDKRYTENEGFSTYESDGVSESAFNLISHGANGHGGYPRGGGTIMFNASSTNLDELTNCACTSTGTAGTYDGTFKSGPLTESSTVATNSFDDIVLYKPPMHLGMTGELIVPACSDSPIGTVCPDGTIYAGISPDGNVPMYATRCDYGQTWGGSSCTGSRTTVTWKNDTNNDYLNAPGIVDCNLSIPSAVSACNAGKSNSAYLSTADSSTLPGTQPHLAAQACESLNINSRDDWYLPSAGELYVLDQNRVALGNSFQTEYYWTSTEASTSSVRVIYLNVSGAVNVAKRFAKPFRCIRH